MNWIEEYGYGGLFAFSFIAATIFPASSEGAVAGALLLGLKPGLVLLSATIGNCLAVLLNYFIGFYLGNKWLNNNKNSRAFLITQKYGWYALFLSWLPVIGDPITVISGVYRWNIVVFISIVFSLRFLRYYFILYLSV